ncbi:formate dehydrogenase subunit delta [Phaeacidiphilus oryzae]|jgi:formate dehydrogenase subunit delta|uniref:formate dehydrogenase subunit delta n=1 Tax=Phaeacidiphilus oryzae TaxID=348818 RepID=UPI0007C83552|nr:formate dehydrogenase subunit delta [Phaeacidiphilus oryzae]
MAGEQQHTAVLPEVRMANGIAAHFGRAAGERAAEAVADHIRRFWDPSMRARLRGLLADGAGGAGGGHGLDPLALAAARLLT